MDNIIFLIFIIGILALMIYMIVDVFNQTKKLK